MVMGRKNEIINKKFIDKSGNSIEKKVELYMGKSRFYQSNKNNFNI